MRQVEGAPAQILLVEDSETQALQIKLLLQGEGYEVRRVASAEEALDALNVRIPDLIIADYHLPGMNGDELARRLRLNISTRGVPILMLTEARERDLERHGLESGADAYVPKSADQEFILLRIKALLRQVASTGAEGRPENALGPLFRRAQILLVDDAAGDGSPLEPLLPQDGYTVTVMQDPGQAIAAATEWTGRWAAVIVNLSAPSDAIALCSRLDEIRNRGMASQGGPVFQIIMVGSGNPDELRDMVVRSFAAGADDVIPSAADREVIRVRIRSLVRRTMVEEENLRISHEVRERELALERARARQLAAEAKASMAEALASANQELESANKRLRETQAQLVHAAKMASLGELVAGIAHEINNPLAFILAHQDTIERLSAEIENGLKANQNEGLTEKAAKARERLRSVRGGLRRIQDLVLNLRKFSRLEEGTFETVNVPEALDAVLALLAPKLGDRIRVERRYEAPETLLCAPALVNQAVMNIVSNAADAIEGNGTITISTTSDDQHYRIDVEDTGPGIPADLGNRIFEPFFTTKPVGSGTGLGLAIAYRVVQAHNGALDALSRPDGGAHFALTVPRHTQQ